MVCENKTTTSNSLLLVFWWLFDLLSPTFSSLLELMQISKVIENASVEFILNLPFAERGVDWYSRYAEGNSTDLMHRFGRRILMLPTWTFTLRRQHEEVSMLERKECHVKRSE